MLGSTVTTWPPRMWISLGTTVGNLRESNGRGKRKSRSRDAYPGGSGVPVSCAHRSSNPSWRGSARAAGFTSRGR
jgi:hypothetical protein